MFPGAATLDQLTAALSRDLAVFLPELILCGCIPLLLIGRILALGGMLPLAPIALLAAATALAFCVNTPAPKTGGEHIFGNMLVVDHFGLSVRAALLAYLVLAIALGMVTKIPDREDAGDFLTLLLGGVVGLMLMTSAAHLLMVFIAVEMASLPSYAMAGFLKGKRTAGEGALKYVIYGAAASGTMLYGISLVAGAVGTGSLLQIAIDMNDARFAAPFAAYAGIALILGGMLFKLSAVPMHFWCPDVFTGAAAEVGAFLSVASKAASLALAARLLFSLGGHGDGHAAVLSAGWGVIAAVTMTWGNLGAFGQANVKRLLAYSTIAHAGLMMMALTAFEYRAVTPLLYYIVCYLCMNFGAFAVVALVRNATGSEEMEAYNGLARRSPVLAGGMTVFLLSLLGLPPLAGFAAKFQVFAHLIENARHAEDPHFSLLSWVYGGLLLVAAVNTAVSAGYYISLIRRMYLENAAEDRTPLPVPIGGRVIVGLLVGGVVALGILWNPLTEQGRKAAKSFQNPSAKEIREEAGRP